jgi:hypothetical protein
LEECEALDTAQIGGTAEGIVDGERRSAALMIAAAGSPGVYVVSQAWDQATQNRGVWVVSVNATCGKATAGAIVPMAAQGFVRDATKVLPRPATKAEVDSALKALDAATR